jgi:hypothetical protein
MLLPVIGPMRVFDLEHLRAIAPAFVEVGVARLELHIEPFAASAALIVFELDFAIDSPIPGISDQQ